ncbi:MAG: cobalamin-dependent protein [Thermodesulfobacteriota bacterium]|nr:cobalamin-dependent protein [Thermodesulfobacteriota bacterium]
MNQRSKIRVMTAKLGIDAHDSGVHIVNHMLRDAGMEVVYMGLYNTADGIARASLDEDVDILGISFLHESYLKHIVDLMSALTNVKSRARVIVGGLIKTVHIPELKEMGVKKVFLPGSTGEEIVSSIRRIADK